MGGWIDGWMRDGNQNLKRKGIRDSAVVQVR